MDTESCGKRARCPGEPLAGPALGSIKLQNGGLLLGVDPGVRYHTSTQRLRRGDVIVCDTDGVKEAMNRNHDAYRRKVELGTVTLARMTHRGAGGQHWVNGNRRCDHV